MRVYRPVGLGELLLIYQSGMRACPPRLPEQPIFYPVLNAPYARRIAREWNTKSGDRAGYVTRFDVEDRFAARYEPPIVGSREHEELWVPAEELDAFNSHIQGRIVVVDASFGADFQGHIPEHGNLCGKSATEQFNLLALSWSHNRATEFAPEIASNATAGFLHYSFWLGHDVTSHDITPERRDAVLRDIAVVWRERFPGIALCSTPPLV
jgi:hypothetical protein